MDAVNGLGKPDFLAVEVGPHLGDCLLWLAAQHPQGPGRPLSKGVQQASTISHAPDTTVYPELSKTPVALPKMPSKTIATST